MRLQGSAFMALLISLAFPLTAVALDPRDLSGLVISVGQAHTQQDNSGAGTALYVDANYSRVFTNLGTGFKNFDDAKIATVYAGVGLAGVLQLQYGFGTEGAVRRIRSDFNFTKAVDFFTGKKRNRYNQSFGTRLTFSFGEETYEDDERFDNFHAGIGLLY